jgi:hypothetical protein
VGEVAEVALKYLELLRAPEGVNEQVCRPSEAVRSGASMLAGASRAAAVRARRNCSPDLKAVVAWFCA